MLLDVVNLSACYGSVQVLDKVSLSVENGEIVTLIGPNGAGKSTVLRAICGLMNAYKGRISSGEINFLNSSIKDVPTYELAKKGLSLVPQGRKIFPSMTVKENLEIGAYLINDRKLINANLEQIYFLLPLLKEKKNRKAGLLSGGEQQMLAVGRGLMLNPKILLLDEPSMGLSPNYIEMIFNKIEEINKKGTSILLVEQNAQIALEHAHRAYVFQIGEIAMQGKAGDLLQNDQVKKIYLGQ